MQRLEPHLDLILEDRPGEEWRDVVGYDGRYSISNHGRVRSESTLRKHSRFDSFYWTKAKVLKQFLNLTDTNTNCVIGLKGKIWQVSNLVFNAFVRLKMETESVMHINKKVWDNRLGNLKIASRSEILKTNYQFGVQKPKPFHAKYELMKQGVFNQGNLIGIICKKCHNQQTVNNFRSQHYTCKNCINLSRRERRKFSQTD